MVRSHAAPAGAGRIAGVAGPLRRHRLNLRSVAWVRAEPVCLCAAPRPLDCPDARRSGLTVDVVRACPGRRPCRLHVGGEDRRTAVSITECGRHGPDDRAGADQCPDDPGPAALRALRHGRRSRCRGGLRVPPVSALRDPGGESSAAGGGWRSHRRATPASATGRSPGPELRGGVDRRWSRPTERASSGTVATRTSRRPRARILRLPVNEIRASRRGSAG